MSPEAKKGLEELIAKKIRVCCGKEKCFEVEVALWKGIQLACSFLSEKNATQTPDSLKKLAETNLKRLDRVRLQFEEIRRVD